jgi:hypothetical protein
MRSNSVMALQAAPPGLPDLFHSSVPLLSDINRQDAAIVVDRLSPRTPSNHSQWRCFCYYGLFCFVTCYGELDQIVQLFKT